MPIVSSEDRRLLEYWRKKRLVKQGFLLTFIELYEKVKDAGILPSDIGHSGYHLCRVNDTGPYDHTSRFLTARENMLERNTHGGRSKEVCAYARSKKKHAKETNGRN
jgi:hypothetical protein